MTKDSDHFCDFEPLAKCQYGVPFNGPEGWSDCGDPACYRVWWNDYNNDFMFVCKEHFDTILKSEEEIECGEKKEA